MTQAYDPEELLALRVAAREAGETPPSLEELCRGREELLEPLRVLVERYEAIDRSLRGETIPLGGRPLISGGAPSVPPAPRMPPKLPGFRVVERLGGGGMGDVWKLEDEQLGRLVAGKVLREDIAGSAALQDFLREARTLASLTDGRIVQILDFRTDGDKPVLLMELVAGFELGKVGHSLERSQQARIMAEACEAIQHAHDRGIQHRDLKPQNILLDTKLVPRIVDFGLASADPRSGHWTGTLPYMAPEQLTPGAPIDARTDVYALGIVLFELLCGSRPYDAESTSSLVAAIRMAHPPLAVEIDSTVPEPLQAIAFKAMEKDPANRYLSAREMARDLRRFLDGQPVLARPTQYNHALAQRVRPHIQDLEEWRGLKLLYPHEVDRLKRVYNSLEVRDEEWIVQSRRLTFARVTLFLGAFLVALGGLFYSYMHVQHDSDHGVGDAALFLLIPFLITSVCASWLFPRNRKVSAIAAFLGALPLLPLFLILAYRELGIAPSPPGDTDQLLGQEISNLQLELALAATWGWAFLIAHRTRTITLGAVSTAVFLGFSAAVLADLGMLRWLDENEAHILGWSLLALVALQSTLGYLLERTGCPWISSSVYLASAAVYVLAALLICAEGNALQPFGFRLSDRFYSGMSELSAEEFDRYTAMSVAGLFVYLAGRMIEKRGTEHRQRAGLVLLILSPYVVLEPLFLLCLNGEFSHSFDVVYLLLSVATIIASHLRQRMNFYYSGLLNTGLALCIIAKHQEWLDKPLWAAAIILAGLLALLAGDRLFLRERLHRES